MKKITTCLTAYYALFLLSGMLMIIGCHNNHPSGKIADQVLPDSIFNIVVKVSSATSITSADLNEFIDSAYCVPLETNTRSLIGNVNKLEILNDTLILFDDQNDLLLTFNKEGRFIRRIGRKGKGPQEYGRIGCFTADHRDNQMWIYDNSKQKILCYSLRGQLKYESPKILLYPFYLARVDGNCVVTESGIRR
ncbi:MAG TPA: 6-bladed beta-propeller [Bacteroidales bacterium]|nr:6-bladed beta-propeller [Bacteroidales bacterium]